jgi:hypothetical protein
MSAFWNTHVSMGVVSVSLALAAVGCVTPSADEDPARNSESAGAALETKDYGDGSVCSCGRGCSCGNSGACGVDGCSGRLGIPWNGNPPGGGGWFGGGGGGWGGPFGGHGGFGRPWAGGPRGGDHGPNFGSGPHEGHRERTHGT